MIPQVVLQVVGSSRDGYCKRTSIVHRSLTRRHQIVTGTIGHLDDASDMAAPSTKTLAAASVAPSTTTLAEASVVL